MFQILHAVVLKTKHTRSKCFVEQPVIAIIQYDFNSLSHYCGEALVHSSSVYRDLQHLFTVLGKLL